MKIACIDNYDSFVYNLVRYLKTDENQPTVRVFRNTDIDYDYLQTCDGILLSPGPGIPSETGDLLRVIEQFHQSKSILGICLGHQALGEFFGAKLEQCAAPIHGKADQLFLKNNSELFQQLDASIQIGRYHSWRIRLENEQHLSVTGISSDGTIQAIQHQTLPLFGLQFHPESILTPQGKTMISNWIKTLKQ
jgi:anthranilate synthase component II